MEKLGPKAVMSSCVCMCLDMEAHYTQGGTLTA